MLTSATDSWLGVMTAAPPQVWLLTLTPSTSKLFAETRWPFAEIGTWFSVWKIDTFDPPGPEVFGRRTDPPLASRAPLPKTPGVSRASSYGSRPYCGRRRISRVVFTSVTFASSVARSGDD